MAYDKDKIFEDSKNLVIENNLFFIEDIVSLLPISKPTFYDFFPPGSNELNDIKSLIDANKVNEKVKIRKELGRSSKAAELLALYRLICTPEEHRLLNQTYIEQKNITVEEEAKKSLKKFDESIENENADS